MQGQKNRCVASKHIAPGCIGDGAAMPATARTHLLRGCIRVGLSIGPRCGRFRARAAACPMQMHARGSLTRRTKDKNTDRRNKGHSQLGEHAIEGRARAAGQREHDPLVLAAPGRHRAGAAGGAVVPWSVVVEQRLALAVVLWVGHLLLCPSRGPAALYMGQELNGGCRGRRGGGYGGRRATQSSRDGGSRRRGRQGGAGFGASGSRRSLGGAGRWVTALATGGHGPGEEGQRARRLSVSAGFLGGGGTE